MPKGRVKFATSVSLCWVFTDTGGGGCYAFPIHIIVIKTVLRHMAETSVGCSIAYMCCSDGWQCPKSDLIRSSFVCNDARTLGLFQYICVMTGYRSVPVCRSLLSSHIYVHMSLIVRLAALWDVWVCTSVVCFSCPLLPIIRCGTIYYNCDLVLYRGSTLLM